MHVNRRLLDLYWSFRDRKLIEHFSKKPGCHFLYLPRQTKKIFVDIYIKAGALVEKEELSGIGHLLEHYLATLTSNEIPNGVTFDAKINDYYIVFYFESDNGNILVDSVQKFLETLAHPDFHHQEIFDYEKKSIINELEKEKNNVELKLERLVEKTRYADEANGRSFVDHLEKLRDLMIEDIAVYHKSILTEGNVEIFVSATKSKPSMCKTIGNAVSKLHLPEGSVGFPKPVYSDFKIQAYDESSVSGNYTVMTFPSFNRSSSLKERMIFALLVEIIRDKDRKNLWQEIRKVGIYDFKTSYSQGIYNGYLALQSHVSREQIVLWTEVVCKMIGELRSGEIDPSQFKKTKEKLADDLLASWRSNGGRFDNLTRCVLEQKEISGYKDVAQILVSVNERDVCAMAERIFKKEKMNLIVFGENAREMEKELAATLGNNRRCE